MLNRRTFGRLLGGAAAAATLPTPRLLAQSPADPGVRLSANENPYGPPAQALQAMREAFGAVSRYPDDEADALAADLATSHGVPAARILLGAGSSEILKLAAAAFTGEKRRLVAADPTFEAIIGHGRAAGAEVVRVPLTDRHAHDLGKMLDAARGAGLVYVCNPNNPTGTITPADALKAFIAALPAETKVVVDEAYHHYTSSPEYDSMMPLTARHPNLIIARTFSKIYGLAGLRCGYAVASEPAIQAMRGQQPWDSVNVMGLVAARAALAANDHVIESRKLNAATREWTREQVERLGFAVLPSQTNFVMIDTRREVRPLITALRGRGVRVGRPFPAMPNHLRVTVGRPEEMRRFVTAFAEESGRNAPAAQQ